MCCEGDYKKLPAFADGFLHVYHNIALQSTYAHAIFSLVDAYAGRTRFIICLREENKKAKIESINCSMCSSKLLLLNLDPIITHPRPEQIENTLLLFASFACVALIVACHSLMRCHNYTACHHQSDHMKRRVHMCGVQIEQAARTWECVCLFLI